MWMFLLVFFSSFAIDAILAYYIKNANNENALHTNISRATISIIGGLMTIQCVNNRNFIFVAALGSFFGTYFTVKIKK